jgi:hypothetical protein
MSELSGSFRTPGGMVIVPKRRTKAQREARRRERARAQIRKLAPWRDLLKLRPQLGPIERALYLAVLRGLAQIVAGRKERRTFVGRRSARPLSRS